MKNLRMLSLVLLVSIFVGLASTPAYAHKMVIEPVEDGKVKVMYDGGNPATRSTITVYNEKDEVIDEGPVDEEGIFEFDPKEASYLESDDGMGHKDTWEVGNTVEESGNDSKLLKIGAVVVVLAGVGIFFSKKDKKEA